MLVPNHHLVTPKSQNEVKAELLQASREIKIDPRSQGEDQGKNQPSYPDAKKRDRQSTSLQGKGDTRAHEVYNQRAQIVHIGTGE